MFTMRTQRLGVPLPGQDSTVSLADHIYYKLTYIFNFRQQAAVARAHNAGCAAMAEVIMVVPCADRQPPLTSANQPALRSPGARRRPREAPAALPAHVA